MDTTKQLSDVTRWATKDETPSADSSPGISSVFTGSDVTVTALIAMTEKPYEEFDEVKVAHMINWIYRPLLVSVGLVCNFLSFVTLVCTSLRTTTTYIYMAAIAVLDSLILVCTFCSFLNDYLGQTAFYSGNDWVCGFLSFLFYFSIHFAAVLMIAMTTDRFIVVKFPLKAQGICTPKSAVRAIVVAGVFSFCLNFHIVFIARLGRSGISADPVSCQYPDSEAYFFMTKIYTWIDASIYSFIPFLSLLIFNTLIIKEMNISLNFSKRFIIRRAYGNSKACNVKTEAGNLSIVSEVRRPTNNRHLSSRAVKISVCGPLEGTRRGWVNSIPIDTSNVRSNVNATTSGAGPSRDKVDSTCSSRPSPAAANITIMLVMVTFTFLLLTSPVVITLLYERYYWLPRSDAEKAKSRLVHAIVDNLMYTNHAVNFLLYCVTGRRFRQKLRCVLGVCFRCRNNTRNPSTV